MPLSGELLKSSADKIEHRQHGLTLIILYRIHCRLLKPIWVSGVPQVLILGLFCSLLLSGKLLQKIADRQAHNVTRRIVGLSVGCFQRKLSPQNRCWGLSG